MSIFSVGTEQLLDERDRLKAKINSLESELEEAKRESTNWYLQYKAMKCAGDTELYDENTTLRSKLAVAVEALKKIESMYLSADGQTARDCFDVADEALAKIRS